MLPILLLFHGVCEKILLNKNNIPNVTNITIVPWLYVKKNLLKQSRFPKLAILPLFQGAVQKLEI